MITNEKLSSYLDEKQFGLPHQRPTVIPSEQGRQKFEFYWAIRAVENALVSMTQKNADERGTVAVIHLWR